MPGGGGRGGCALPEAVTKEGREIPGTAGTEEQANEKEFTSQGCQGGAGGALSLRHYTQEDTEYSVTAGRGGAR